MAAYESGKKISFSVNPLCRNNTAMGINAATSGVLFIKPLGNVTGNKSLMIIERYCVQSRHNNELKQYLQIHINRSHNIIYYNSP